MNDLSDTVRAGYRSAYLHELATRIADGSLPVESWRNSESPSEELYRAIRSIKGFGDYAAGTMLRLLGRFDRLGIDTSCRKSFRAQTNNAAASDADIRRYYEAFGPWRGLVMWMDVMRPYLQKHLVNYERRSNAATPARAGSTRSAP